MPVEPVQYLRLDLEISVPYSVVLEGLNAWFKWELISEVDFKWRDNRSSRVCLINRLIAQDIHGLIIDDVTVYQ